MDLNALKWDANGLLPVVIADDRTSAVLTLAYANREALQRTITERSTYLFSRSRNALWHKGETSGNTQEVVSVAYDCDADALLYRVIPNGPACHTGAESCFHHFVVEKDPRQARSALRQAQDALRQAQDDESLAQDDEASAFVAAIAHLETVLEQRKTDSPQSSYVAKLYEGGVDKIGKKIGEEATEVVIAAKNASREELTWESADLMFHLLVLLKHAGVSLDEVGGELLRRAK
jgi:phosphoribosyl-ATP pyrophosphohydrolase/phosphoribosyl-AMP cyclohydrolase